MQIGFVGLGNMGGPMAENLAKAGYEILGFDIAAQPSASIPLAPSLDALAGQASTIITMLPDGAIMEEVVATFVDRAGTLIQPNTLFVDCSTVDVASARRAANRIQAAGHTALDAPVSGGTAGAAAGTLTFMVGGHDAAVQRAKPLFDVMGAKMFHCGGNGAGQAAKICNNMILGVTMIATCEAFALADGLKLDRQALFDVVSASSGQSWSMTTYCPAPGVGPTTPADHGYAPGFAVDLMLKDLMLAREAAETAGIDTALGAHARDLYAAFQKAGGSGQDFSAILKTMMAKVDDQPE